MRWFFWGRGRLCQGLGVGFKFGWLELLTMCLAPLDQWHECIFLNYWQNLLVCQEVIYRCFYDGVSKKITNASNSGLKLRTFPANQFCPLNRIFMPRCSQPTLPPWSPMPPNGKSTRERPIAGTGTKSISHRRFPKWKIPWLNSFCFQPGNCRANLKRWLITWPVP